VYWIDKEIYEKLKANDFSTNNLVLTDRTDSLRIMLEVTILAWLESAHARNKSVDFALTSVSRSLSLAKHQFETAIKQAYPDKNSWTKTRPKLKDLT